MNLKKSIAREGLILLSIAIGGFLIALMSDYLVQHSKAYCDDMLRHSVVPQYEPLSFGKFWNRTLGLFELYDFPSVNYSGSYPLHKIWFLVWFEHFGEFIFLYGYLIYLPIRFVFWAVRTLKNSV